MNKKILVPALLLCAITIGSGVAFADAGGNRCPVSAGPGSHTCSEAVVFISPANAVVNNSFTVNVAAQGTEAWAFCSPGGPGPGGGTEYYASPGGMEATTATDGNGGTISVPWTLTQAGTNGTCGVNQNGNVQTTNATDNIYSATYTIDTTNFPNGPYTTTVSVLNNWNPNSTAISLQFTVSHPATTGVINVTSENSQIPTELVHATWSLYGPQPLASANVTEDTYPNVAFGPYAFSGATANDAGYAFNSIKMIPIASKSGGDALSGLLSLANDLLPPVANAISYNYAGSGIGSGPNTGANCQNLSARCPVGNYIILWDPVAGMSLSQTTLTGSGTVTVTNSGTDGSSLIWSAISDSPSWLSVSPAADPTGLLCGCTGASDTVTITVIPAGVTPGATVTGHINFQGTSVPGIVQNPFTPSVTVTYTAPGSAPTDNPPLGNQDSVTNSTCSTAGWSFDPDTSAQSINVDIYRDGTYSTGVYLGRFLANVSRPDVDAVYGISGNHGFNAALPASLDDGLPHAIYVYGIDSGGTNNPLLSNSPMTITCPVPIPPPPTVNVNAPSTNPINSGDSTTITWTTTGITNPGTPCTVTASGVPGSLGSFAANGPGASVTVSPSVDTTYIVSCKGPGGSGSGSQTVNVNPPVPAPGSVVTNVAASCSPNSIPVNSGTTCTAAVTVNGAVDPSWPVTWTVVSGAGVFVNPGIGSYTASSTGGLVTVQATSAPDSNGATISGPATITVTAPAPQPPAPPIVAITGPGGQTTVPPIVLGGSVQITWQPTPSSGPVSSCMESAGSSWSGISGKTGSRTVQPASAGTYTYGVTCTGLGGTTTQTPVTVVVNNLPIVVTQTNPPVGTNPSVTQPITFTCTGGNGTYIWSAPGPATYPSNTSSTFVVTYSATGPYTITCNDSAGDLPGTKSIMVAPLPPQCTFASSPSTIVLPQTSSLNWTCTGAVSCVITGGTLPAGGESCTGPLTSPGSTPSNGSLPLSPTITTSYTLTAQGPGSGSGTSISFPPATVTVTGPGLIECPPNTPPADCQQ